MADLTKIVIIGAGIGGLACALALHRKGIKASIYEAMDHCSINGAGITLSLNAMNVLQYLGVAEQIIESGQVVNAIGLSNKTGEVLSINDLTAFNQNSLAPCVAINRKYLHDILLTALPDQTVRFSKRLNSVDLKSRVCSFNDNLQVDFDLLIGCDGLHSALRKLICLDKPIRDAKQICYRGVAQLSRFEGPRDQLIEAWGTGKRFGYVHIGDDQFYWYATIVNDRTAAPLKENIKSFLDNEFADWNSTVGQLLNAQDQSKILRNDLFDKQPSKQWSRGQAVLLGDAIHPSTPNLGQGAGMAIESAVVLANCLAQDKSVSAAIDQYQNIRLPRTRDVTQQSWRIGGAANLQNEALCAARNVAIKLVPNWLTNKGAEKMMSYDAVNIVNKNSIKQ